MSCGEISGGDTVGAGKGWPLSPFMLRLLREPPPAGFPLTKILLGDKGGVVDDEAGVEVGSKVEPGLTTGLRFGKGTLGSSSNISNKSGSALLPGGGIAFGKGEGGAGHLPLAAAVSNKLRVRWCDSACFDDRRSWRRGCLGGEGDLNGGTRGVDDVGGGRNMDDGFEGGVGGLRDMNLGLSGTRGGSDETRSPKSSNVTG